MPITAAGIAYSVKIQNASNDSVIVGKARIAATIPRPISPIAVITMLLERSWNAADPSASVVVPRVQAAPAMPTVYAVVAM